MLYFECDAHFASVALDGEAQAITWTVTIHDGVNIGGGADGAAAQFDDDIVWAQPGLFCGRTGFDLAHISANCGAAPFFPRNAGRIGNADAQLGLGGFVLAQQGRQAALIVADDDLFVNDGDRYASLPRFLDHFLSRNRIGGDVFFDELGVST